MREKERGRLEVSCSPCLVSSLQSLVCVCLCVCGGQTGLSSVACRTTFSLTKKG